MKDFTGKNWGKGQIDLRKHEIMVQLVPIEIHLKEDGAISGPSITIVLSHQLGALLGCAYGQISLEMFNEGLADIGYQIVKK